MGVLGHSHLIPWEHPSSKRSRSFPDTKKLVGLAAWELKKLRGGGNSTFDSRQHTMEDNDLNNKVKFENTIHFEPQTAKFKMEPDTTELDFNLIPLSPINHGLATSNEVYHSLDLPLGTLSSDSDDKVSITSAGGGLKHARKSKIQQPRRRSNSSMSCKIRVRKNISEAEAAAQRNQANVRERARTQSLNEAFQNLRQSIPTMPSDKMSKIQTLKLASDYIGFLYTVLREGEPENGRAMAAENGNDKNLSYYFNMWRMQDVWNSSNNRTDLSS